jgi:hypothetical protein
MIPPILMQAIPRILMLVIPIFITVKAKEKSNDSFEKYSPDSNSGDKDT